MERIDLRGLEDVLGIYSPWTIKSATANDKARTIDVNLELGDRTRLFNLFGSNKSGEPSERGSWHYISLGKYRVVIHGQIPGSASSGPALNYSTLNQACFLGSPLRNYSNYLRQQVALAHVRGLQAEAIVELYQVDPEIVSSILEDLNSAPSQVQSLACLATELDPVWEKILRGEVSFNTQVLPFRLLLSKLQMSANSAKRPSEIQPLALELRKFFIANAAILDQEITQIFGRSAKPGGKNGAGMDSIKKLILPGLGNPVWQEVLTGRLPLNSSNVALNLLVAKQKAAFTYANETSDKLAAIEIVRSYFLKNYRSLKPELLLLNRACAIREKTKFRLPEADHSIWQQILQDDSVIPSNHVAYKLLLARLRSQVRTAPSPAAKLEAARRIREFIKQNHRSMKHELVYLIKQATAA